MREIENFLEGEAVEPISDLKYTYCRMASKPLDYGKQVMHSHSCGRRLIQNIQHRHPQGSRRRHR